VSRKCWPDNCAARFWDFYFVYFSNSPSSCFENLTNIEVFRSWTKPDYSARGLFSTIWKTNKSCNRISTVPLVLNEPKQKTYKTLIILKPDWSGSFCTIYWHIFFKSVLFCNQSSLKNYATLFVPLQYKNKTS
jgi:hypothetical protein